MNTYTVEVTATIDAPAAAVYAILADYHDGHPAILPAPYFTGLIVIEGGYGAGTVAETTMNVFGARRTYLMAVSEPEPGRVLREEDAAAGLVTVVTVDPVDEGRRSQVTFLTTSRVSPGLKGWLEKLMNPPITRRIYREEMQLLAERATDQLVAAHG